MQIAIDLPSDFVAILAVPGIWREIRISYAFGLCQRGWVTLVKAAELAGFDLYDFMRIGKAIRAPVIEIKRNALIEERLGFTLP